MGGGLDLESTSRGKLCPASSSLGQMKLSGYRQLERLPLGDTGREE